MVAAASKRFGTYYQERNYTVLEVKETLITKKSSNFKVIL